MQILITSQGAVRCIYAEAIDLALLGSLSIERASHVEPNAHGQWFVSFAPLDGPTLGPFSLRSEALAAEQRWLTANWL